MKEEKTDRDKVTIPALMVADKGTLIGINSSRNRINANTQTQNPNKVQTEDFSADKNNALQDKKHS